MILIITVRVTGGKVNRGAGYGLEIPCVYRFNGPLQTFYEVLQAILKTFSAPEQEAQLDTLSPKEKSIKLI